MVQTIHYRRQLSGFVRTSTAYDLIHEEHARMLDTLLDEVDRLNDLVKKKDAEINELKLLPHSQLNIDRAQLAACGTRDEQSRRTATRPRSEGGSH